MTTAAQHLGYRAGYRILGVALIAFIALTLTLSSCNGEEKTPDIDRVDEKPKEWTSLVDGSKVLDRIKRICDLGPRQPGTKGAESARSEIEKQLREVGFTWAQLKRQTWTEKTPDPKQIPSDANKDPSAWPNETKFVNLIAVLPGKNKEGVALAAHYDSKVFDFSFVGANDSASAVAGIIELAAMLLKESKTKPRENSVYFIFFDGEEAIRNNWADPDNRYGSRHFVDQMIKQGDKFEFPLTGCILLDMIAAKKLRFAEEKNSDSHVIKLFKDEARKIFGYAPFSVPRGGAIIDDHVSFKGTKVVVMDLIDANFDSRNHNETIWWHTEEDTMEHLDKRSLEMALTLTLAVFPAVEEFCNR